MHPKKLLSPVGGEDIGEGDKSEKDSLSVEERLFIPLIPKSEGGQDVNNN